MNILDKKIEEFTTIIQGKSLSEIIDDITKSFTNLPEATQQILVDYFKKYPYWGTLSPKEGNYQEIKNRAIALKDHIKDFHWLYDHLNDSRSRFILLAILNNWYQYDFKNLKKAKETIFPDYFDFDLFPVNNRHVILDLGAYIGDTVTNYISCFGDDSYQKIYCYEITPAIFKELTENMKKYPNIECRFKAVSDKSDTFSITLNPNSSSANRIGDEGEEKIEAIAIDDDIKEKITVIKMDIEGAEQRALQGCKNHIVKDYPILLISVYHNYEDLWKIPKMIYDMRPDYDFYLRYYGGDIFPTEITLLAIPQKF